MIGWNRITRSSVDLLAGVKVRDGVFGSLEEPVARRAAGEDVCGEVVDDGGSEVELIAADEAATVLDEVDPGGVAVGGRLPFRQDRVERGIVIVERGGKTDDEIVARAAGHRVDTGSADQQTTPRAADECVVPSAADQDVAFAVASQLVVSGTASNVHDIGKRSAKAGRGTRRKIGGDGRCVCSVVEPVVAGTTIDQTREPGSVTQNEDVLANATGDPPEVREVQAVGVECIQSRDVESRPGRGTGNRIRDVDAADERLDRREASAQSRGAVV